MVFLRIKGVDMKIVLRLLILSMFLLNISACKDEQKQVVQGLPTVEAIKVYSQDVPLNLEYSARTQGSKETDVRARVGGILLKRNYVEGTRVNEGDVLFEIDPEPYKVILAQAQAKLAQIQAQLTAAESQWKRISKLFDERIVSEKSRDEAKANLEALEASLKLAQAEVDSAQLNLDYTSVTAPIAGITSMETVSEGSLIAVNNQLTKITQLDPIYVNFSASENELFKLASMVEKGLIVNTGAINDGDSAMRRKLSAKLRYNNGQLYSEDGEIDFVNPAIDETTGTLKLRATFPNPDKKLIPGQFVRLSLDSIVRKNAILIPQEAVMQGAKGAFVYRLNTQNMVENVTVETGTQTADGKWIIDEGLKDGDVIITNGLMKVRPGIPVQAIIKDINLTKEPSKE
ncbi:MAG: efflux RND transporter periplasmic adaptor subunit [Alphaproteobacteria bacterium]|nr:efflux RND transporter periplasmic adaptor subunit [Alphaproteobacteria bacterium]